VALRIGFDLDGVFADMDGALAKHATDLFGSKPAEQPPDRGTEGPAEEAAAPAEGEPEAPSGGVDLSSSQLQRLWRHVGRLENFWETLEEIEPGSLARLATLAAEHRWELIFLTKRPHTVGYTAQVQSQRWLAARGFPMPSVYVVQRSRGKIAAALGLDIVVDDRPENCLDVVVDSKARAILVWRADRELMPAAAKRLGIGVVTSMGQCLDLLAEIDAPDPPPERMVDRVMRILGLKDEPARV